MIYRNYFYLFSVIKVLVCFFKLYLLEIHVKIFIVKLYV